MDAILEQLLAQRRLANQAERLSQRLRMLSRHEADAESEPEAARARRVSAALARSLDREDRRNNHYWRLLAGKPIVTTAQVAGWVRDNIANYRVVGGADPVEVAGDVTNALDLWDEHESIPQWVHGVCEREVEQDSKLAPYRMQFFVEKVINYTETGDVLWA